MNKIDIEKISEGNHKVYSELIETFEKVKDAIKKQNFGIAMDILCKPYPAFQVITLSSELKESEDEKSKKWILEYLHDGLRKSDEQFKDHFKAAIAWLEKQGGKDEEILILKDQIESLHAAIKAIKETHRIELEKRGEQNLANSCKTCKDEPKFRVGDTIHKIGENTIFQMVIEEIKNGEYVCDNNHSFINIKFQDDYELVEQKPADKVEPKFHEGEWVVYECGEETATLQITRIVGETYVFSDDSTLGVVDEDTLRLWDITKDAKDGDVLRIRNLTFIFQEITNNNVCHKDAVVAYCSYEDHDDGFGVCGPDCITDLEIITPATKEQRDLLFQKMKEAGYEWDADKKELKKIEEEVNGEDYGIDSLYHAQRILEKTLGKVDGYQSDDGILEHKCAISAVKKLYEQKPAWSEEDEKEFEQLLNILHANGYESFDIWLKSLKDRYTWKPSEEQMDALLFVVQHYTPNVTDKLAWDSIKILELMYYEIKQ